MIIKNNSDREWKDYNCGNGVFVTIKPKSTFEVDDEAGVVLLRNLGHPNWLVEVEKEEVKSPEPEPAKKSETAGLGEYKDVEKEQPPKSKK